MVRRSIGLGIVCLGIVLGPTAASPEATSPTVPQKKNVLRAETETARASAAAPDLSKSVVSLPEEIVRAGGIHFGDGGEVRFTLPSREALRLPGGFADPTRYIQSLPGVGNDSDFDGLLFVRGG